MSPGRAAGSGVPARMRVRRSPVLVHRSMAGSGPATYHMIEKGRRHLRPGELIGFSRVLRVPITWLLGVPDYE